MGADLSPKHIAPARAYLLSNLFFFHGLLTWGPAEQTMGIEPTGVDLASQLITLIHLLMFSFEPSTELASVVFSLRN